MKTLTLAVEVKLPLRWNTYLLLNTDTVDFDWKTDEGETESIVFLIFLWWCLNCRPMRGSEVEQKVLLKGTLMQI